MCISIQAILLCVPDLDLAACARPEFHQAYHGFVSVLACSSIYGLGLGFGWQAPYLAAQTAVAGPVVFFEGSGPVRIQRLGRRLCPRSLPCFQGRGERRRMTCRSQVTGCRGLSRDQDKAQGQRQPGRPTSRSLNMDALSAIIGNDGIWRHRPTLRNTVGFEVVRETTILCLATRLIPVGLIT